MGEQLKIQAIVLNKVDFKDNDRILTLFSPVKGKVTVSVKGVKKQNSKLRAGSEVFAFGTYILTETRGRYTVTGYDSIDSFHELREDFDRLSFAAMLLKITEKAVSENEGDVELFSLLIDSLHKLRGDFPLAYTVAVFLMKFCSIFGYQPELNKCVGCGCEEDLVCLSPQAGGVACLKCNNCEHIVITGGCLYYLRKIYSGDDPFIYKPTEKQIKELYRTACYYTAYFFDEKIKIMDYINKYQLV